MSQPLSCKTGHFEEVSSASKIEGNTVHQNVSNTAHFVTTSLSFHRVFYKCGEIFQLLAYQNKYPN
jgi:hypothetical protein